MNPTTVVNHRNKKSGSDYFLDPKNEVGLDLSDIASKYTEDGTKLLDMDPPFTPGPLLHKGVKGSRHSGTTHIEGARGRQR
jgi:hypothetical protein